VQHLGVERARRRDEVLHEPFERDELIARVGVRLRQRHTTAPLRAFARAQT
jgi:hypothetical protein